MRRAFKATVIGTLLFSSAIANIAVQAADDDARLRGITSVRYELWGPEVMFGDRENDCKIDRGAWQAAMDSVANKSEKLKIISHQAESDAMHKDLEDGKCHIDFKDRDDLPSCFTRHQKKPMPELRFFVTAAKIENTCLAQVEAKVWDPVEGNTKFRSSGRDALVTIAEMWSSTYWVKDSEDNFTRSIAKFSAAMMKELLDEWTRVNCSDCYISGDGGTPPKWVAKGRRAWATWPNVNVAAGIEQDGAEFVVMCDPGAGRALHPDSRGLILIQFHEPRANWPKDAKVEMMTISDDGRPRPSGASNGTATGSTTVLIKNEATWELSVIADAKESFTIKAGSYTRSFPATNLRKAVEPVLEACGDHW
jgi:hypothetical protein